MKYTERPLPDIPPDREDGRSSWVHLALIFSGRLGKIFPIKLLPIWIGLVVIAGWPWRTCWLVVSIIAGVLLLIDWSMLALLPITQRSWGPVTPQLLGLTAVRLVLFWLLAWLVPTQAGLWMLVVLQGMISAAAIYGTWIEPFRVGVTHMRFAPPDWRGERALRIVHLSDIHFEGFSPRERAILEQVEQLRPDIIVLTGDYLNLSSVYDPDAQQGARQLLRQLHAPLGVYAITGSPVVDFEGIVPEIFEGLSIQWLNDKVMAVPVEGDALWLIGVRCTYQEARDLEVLKHLVTQVPPNVTTILLYHTPDLMPTAAELGIDLYLCGHTHGGQLRVPLYGALATSSKWGKRYEMGRYREAQTTLYVSRGLGMEGLGAPRARFLAEPEMIVWDIARPSECVSLLG